MHFRATDYLKTTPVKPLPTRSEQLKALEDEIYDVLVIGGGSTGAGCALDSVSRDIYVIKSIKKIFKLKI